MLNSILFIITFVQTALSAPPKQLLWIDLSQGRSNVEFEAKANPGEITINGEAAGTPIEGKLKMDQRALSGSLKVKLERLKTGIKIRWGFC